VKSHEYQGGKLIFNKTKGPYQILKTDGRCLTIESTHGIRTKNSTHQGLWNNDSDKAPFCKQRLSARSNILYSSVFPRRA